MDEHFHSSDPGHCSYLLDRTRYYAKLLGLPEEDAEDCALETVEAFLLKASFLIPADWSEEQVKHWLDTRAWRSALNYRKKWLRQEAHKLPLLDDNPNLEAHHARRFDDAAGRPDAVALGSELGQRFGKAISRLSPAQQELIYRRRILQESTQEIAVALGRPPHAVDEAFSRAKKRLRQFLQEEKLDMAECLDYLAAMSGH